MIKIMNQNGISKNILLLGAGFSKNFGVPTAQDIWYEIFNRVSEYERLSKLMDGMKYDFEKVYYTVLEGEYTQNEKDAIEQALKNTFEGIDKRIRNWSNNPGTPYSMNIYGIQKHLISAFAVDKKSFIFTLNQDLLLERLHYNGRRPCVPGVTVKPNWFTSIFSRPLEDSSYARLPDSEQINTIKESIIANHDFFYVKLHGSQNWLGSNGKEMVVFGQNKLDKIIQEPLLKWYYEVFQQVLVSGDVRLMIIGYGFGDPHINAAIVSGIEKGLSIHIITPQEWDGLSSAIRERDTINCDKLISAIKGYYKMTLGGIFPADQSTTMELEQIYASYFKRKIV